METDYVDWLAQELIRRKERNSRYSERAFAAAIGLSPGFFKHLLQRKKDLSTDRARDVARRLNWSETRTEQFLGRVSRAKDHAANRAPTRRVLDKSEAVNGLSDWFALALAELLDTGNYDDICEAANRLGISTTEAQFALRALLAFGIVTRRGNRWLKACKDYEIPSMATNAIRKFHRQTLARAIAAIDHQDYNQRDLRALTLSFDRKRMTEAEEEIAKFVTRFEKKFAKGQKDSVYQMNIAFYRVDTEEK